MADTARDTLVARVRERLREALARGPEKDRAVREVAMFGGVSFMVSEQLVVAARNGGALLVRVDPARHDELAARPGAATAQMGARTMGAGWITVDPEVLESPDGLGFWIDVALRR